ncbi:hypothetical protein PHYSODRAFT_512195 [Phytophthora sojae]|uniref:Uncharacterized protein n=1 Tax=Phytophthora sojae (strain P6497) TaxID=1094619 RepID=G4ZSK3_PHYSP|nr:hypothetical protein PHYSODRAFT_512195 [Phytophthora sojae]EGZ14225.1 hypothetical protein PHYSODRAFT_512195 [Phytophthora sojae]|eukprot:XP_009531654.1 hypothetical protein PHYSODRAFT_512195 [Phytophthora sojae]
MTNAVSRQKANNAKNVTAAAPASAQVKPACATVVKNAQMTTTVATTQSTTKNLNGIKVNVVKTTVANGSKPFTLNDVTTWSVQRAREIRKTDFKRFAKLHNYFTAKDDAVARPINSKANAKREDVDLWVRSVLNSKTLACIQGTQETQQALLSLITVSAALSKYGEPELVRKNSFGEMDTVIGARFGTKGLQSKQQAVGVSFVLRIVLGLAPEKRAACQSLREILELMSHQRLVLAPTAKGLTPTSNKVAEEWTKVNQYKLKYMVKQAQSDKFQEAMQQLGGQHLYDGIRTQLQQIGGAWDASKDKPALQAKNLRPRSNPTEKGMKQQKETERRKGQHAKNSRVNEPSQLEKKYLPLEAAMWTQIPPVPVSVKTDQRKNTPPTDKVQVIPAKSATPVKSAPLTGAWAGPLPASVVLSRPSAIVSSAPTMSARGGNGRGHRAILSRAI